MPSSTTTAVRATTIGIAATVLLTLSPAMSTAVGAAHQRATTATTGATDGGAGSETMSPPVSFPRHPKGMSSPRQWRGPLDDPAMYQMQQACVATPSRGIVKLRALALSTYHRGGSSPATPRACTSGSTSEHKDGRAWDWMLNVHNRADKRAAADFLAWITGPGPSGEPGELARRLGIMYVIYNHKSWAAYRGSWQRYTGSDPHTSHIHISLSWNGARAHTSFWTGHAWAVDYGTCQVFRGQPAVSPTATPRLTPCPAPVTAPRLARLPLQWLGSSGAGVRKGQRLLNQPVTGTFGATTRRAVLRYQAAHDLPRTGALDKPTWASLAPSARRLTAPDWTPREAKQWGRANAAQTVLRHGSVGRAVYALQVALKLPDADRNGMLGRQTAAAVIALKKANGLAANAVVNQQVWRAL
ncbi:MAG: peptidoglycan-binding domain-containing protein [Nocardioidaceae bacterium]